MRRVHLVVAVRAEKQEVRELGAREQGLDDVEGRRVGPLQIVEEEDDGMAFAREDPDEALERRGEAVLRLDEARLRRGRLGPEDLLERWGHLDDEARVRPEAREDPLLPVEELRLALGEQLVAELVERRAERGVRHRAMEQIELAGDEEA